MTTASDTPDMEERFCEPKGWSWGTFKNVDGAKLRYGRIYSDKDPVGTVIVCPGFTEFIEKYFELVRDLHAAGYNVWALDWRGQGGSQRWLDDPLKPFSMGFERDARDLAQFVEDVVDVEPDGKLVLLAHSMGGHIALRALHDHGDLFNCAILSAPMAGFYTRPYPRWLAKLILNIGLLVGMEKVTAPGDTAWRYKIPPIETDPRSQDPVRRCVHIGWYEKKPELRLGGPTFGWVGQAFRSVGEVMKPAYLAEIKTPVLIGTAGDDSIVRIDSQAHLVKLLPEAEQRFFPGARHELWMEHDGIRAPWLKSALKFMEKHLA